MRSTWRARDALLVCAALALALHGATAQQRTSALVSDTSTLNATSAAPSDGANDKTKYTVSQLLQATGDAKIAPGIFAVATIVVGLVVCAAGYRLFRASVFVCGFVGGGLAVARGVESMFSTESYVVAASWIAFVAGGLVIGCTVMALYYAGIFAVGAACGVLVAITFNAGVGHKMYASDPNAVLLALAIILGLAGGMLAVCLEKPALIVLTSFLGAGLAVWGVGYFAGDFPSGDTLQRFRADSKGDMPWLSAIPSAWWGYLAALAALTLLGVVLQRSVTSRDGYYDAQKGFVKHTLALPSHYRVRFGTSRSYSHAQTPSPRRRPRRARTLSAQRRRESDYIV